VLQPLVQLGGKEHPALQMVLAASEQGGDLGKSAIDDDLPAPLLEVPTRASLMRQGKVGRGATQFLPVTMPAFAITHDNPPCVVVIGLCCRKYDRTLRYFPCVASWC
jgi:hypothetical protein